MTTWFTSDTHFGHKNIINYCNRPFKDTKEMDAALIANWQRVVGMEDTVYFLGDLGFASPDYLGECLAQLPGKLYWVLGNHDDCSKHKKVSQWFKDIQQYMEVKVPVSRTQDDGSELIVKQKIILCHYPFQSWRGMGHGNWHLHGHTHGTYLESKKLIHDVGVDINNFTPVSTEQIQAMFALRTVKP